MKKTQFLNLAVFGNPILHSKSPDIFRYLASRNNISINYLRILCTEPQDIIYLINKFSLSGANITSPFKQSIIPFLDEIDPAAKKIGAVNTILNVNKKLIGYNTDHYGIVKPLKIKNINLENKKVLILGAGGAACSAVYAFKTNGSQVYITNRTQSKASKLSHKFNIKVIPWGSIHSHIKKFDIIISTLSHFPESIHNIKLHERQIIIDSDYHNSVLKRIAKKNSANFINNRLWLIFQALEAFSIFTNSKKNNFKLPEIEVLFHKKNIKNKILLSGFMGCGKSTIGARIAHALHLPFSDIDNIIEEETNLKINKIFKTQGEEEFRKLENRVLIKLLSNNNPEIIASGGGLVCSTCNHSYINEKCINLFLYTNFSNLIKRIANSPLEKRPLANDLKNLENLFQQRLLTYLKLSDMVIYNKSLKVIDDIIINLKKIMKII